MSKSPDAFRTISEVSEWLDTPTYVLRFWESRFPQIKPVKRAGGRRYYRPEDMMLLGGIKKLLHFDEKTIKSVKALLKEKGVKHVMDLSPDLNTQVVSPQSDSDASEQAEIAEMVKSAPKGQKKAGKPKPKVEVRVVKKGKLAETEADADPQEGEVPQVSSSDKERSKAAQEKAKADEAARQEAAKKAAAEKALADEEAESWDGLAPDMITNVPYRIGHASSYDDKTLGEIETLYYSLRMARNSMRRAKAEQENRAN